MRWTVAMAIVMLTAGCVLTEPVRPFFPVERSTRDDWHDMVPGEHEYVPAFPSPLTSSMQRLVERGLAVEWTGEEPCPDKYCKVHGVFMETWNRWR